MKQDVISEKNSSRRPGAQVAVKRGLSSRMTEICWAYGFILPAFLFLAFFHLLPAAASAFISLMDWDGLGRAAFVGLDNYIALVRNSNFLQAGLHTAFFTVVTVPVTLILATGVALALNRNLKGRTFYRTLYFIPVVTMATAVGLIWKWLYNSEFGPINAVLRALNLPEPMWLADPKLILPSIMVVSIWSSVGHHMIVLLAGLQGIEASYYEAAAMDGAGRFYVLFRITLPLLSPSLFFVLLTSTIQALQLFDLVFVMTGGNPTLLRTSRSVVYNVYEEAFRLFNMGGASAQAVVLFIVILAITILQMKLQRKWVHY